MKAEKLGKKGLSPLLAIIIGLIVTIVAGILLAQLYFSYAATISARPAANVEYSDLVVTSDGSGILALNIKNTGNVPIDWVSISGTIGGVELSENACTIYYSTTTATAGSGGDIGVSGGRTLSITCSINGVSAGDTGNVKIVVGFGDGSTQAYAITIRARSA